MTATTMITIGIIIFIIIFIIHIYNKLIRSKQLAKEAFSTIDVFLKKRYDIIPMLVSTVKGAKDHEENVLKEITKLRSRGIEGNLSVKELGENELKLSERINQLMVQIENYPEIRANDNFKALQDSLMELEGDIGSARRYYNATVREYLIYKKQFPNVIISASFNFPNIDYFGLEDISERKPPNVNF